MHHRTLLLVDDHAPWVKITTKFLLLFEYKIITAGNCADGLKMIQTHRPDCVLLDFHLPDAEGCMVSLQVRESAELRKIPIIMVSGDEEQESVAYEHYKVDGFFFKMWPLERLRGMIKVLLGRIDMERGRLTHDDLHLDGENLKVFRDSEPVAQLSQDQFSFLSLLVTKTPGFVPEEAVVKHVFGETGDGDKMDAVKMLAYRIRQKLGAVLGRRIKCAKNSGWVYVRPRSRASKCTAPPPQLSPETT